MPAGRSAIAAGIGGTASRSARYARFLAMCCRGINGDVESGRDYEGELDIETTNMRATVTLDETLLTRAQTLCGNKGRSALLHDALEALIQRESARRLAALGGSEPQLLDIPRRREDRQ